MSNDAKAFNDGRDADHLADAPARVRDVRIDFRHPEFPPERQVELIGRHRMLRAEDIAAARTVLARPWRTAVSLMRMEIRLGHP